MTLRNKFILTAWFISLPFHVAAQYNIRIKFGFGAATFGYYFNLIQAF
jgi:hypothetical protein